MTKKQAYKIIKKEYGNYKGDYYIPALCLSLPRELKFDFQKYWVEINTEDHTYVSCAFPDSRIANVHDVPISLARLMLLHDFIEDTYD